MNLENYPKPKKGFIAVTVQKEKDTEKTKAGIIIPNEQKELNAFLKGEVKAVGADKDSYTMETKVGDKILVKKDLVKFADQMITVDFEEVYLIREQSGFYGWVE